MMTGPIGLITFDLVPTLWDATADRAQTDLTALAQLRMIAPLGLVAVGDWPLAQKVQQVAGVVFDACDLAASPENAAALWREAGPRLRRYGDKRLWWHVTADPDGERLARQAGAHVAFVPRSGADSGQWVVRSEAELLVSDLHQLALGMRQGPVRYEVTAVAAHPKFLKEYIKWIADEHGPELLACDGCLEFRVLRVNDTTARSEYLFRHEEAMQQYLERDAPRLRAKALERFPPDWLSLSRTQSILVASQSRHFPSIKRSS